MAFPEPVVSIVIEPKSRSDQEELLTGLGKLEDEDPTFKVRCDRETGQTIISGMGELHLEVLVERLLREFNVHANVGKPEVAFRETITRTAEAEGRFIGEAGGRNYYGHVVMRFDPLPNGSGFIFENQITGGSIPKEYIPAVKIGIEEVMTGGVSASYPMVDFRAVLMDGSYSETESNEMAFKIAASMAYKTGIEKAEPVILEPLMIIEIFTPEEFLGDLISDISAKMGRIVAVEDRSEGKVITGYIALRSIFGYSTELRSMTKGRATFTTKFSEYRQVPGAVQKEIIEKIRTGY
jgi:elongation factor G